MPSLAVLFAVTALAAEPDADQAPKTEVDISGLYTAWGLTQRNFLLGDDHPLDDAGYTVQMLRTQVAIKRGKMGATARLDAGQGWWGANNDPNSADVTTLDADGEPVESNAYNEDKLFGNKDTHYTVHFDHVYGWAEFDVAERPLRVQVGRQYFGVGNKLVLDQDYDGVQVMSSPIDGLQLTGMWAKVSEGRGSFKDPRGLLMSDEGEFNDANLVGLTAHLGRQKNGDDAGTPHHGEVFALYYWDAADGDEAFLPNGYGYLRNRHVPQVTSLLAVGAAADGRLGAADTKSPLNYKAEVDFLVGTDGIDNADHGGGTVDINNGQLMGYNAYLDVTQSLDVAKGMDVGLVGGFGSGDADKTGGAGNVNKIQTMGFFPFTNVWEDSVMPDVEGISPQGLGSPVSRGYREFENTIAAQAKFGVKPVKPLRIELSYTYLRATTPIQGFDAAGIPTGAASSDLGMEVDANVILKFGNGLVFKTLGGVFLPGDGAALLINGDTDSTQPAWEIKNVALVKF